MSAQASATRDAKGQKDGVWVSHECGFCGAKGGQYLRHYDVLRCSCGHFFWALRPLRNGPLVLRVWPGRQRIEAPA